MTRSYLVENLDCANCAAKAERKMQELPEVKALSLTFATKRLKVTAEDPDALLPRLQQVLRSVEPEARIVELHRHEHHDHHHDHHETGKDWLIWVGAGLFVLGQVLEIKAVLVLSYLLLGLPVLKNAALGLVKGKVLDENFLMSVATIGAFFIDQFPEAVGVMLFYRVGEFFEHKAVDRSRKQIMDALDMRPETVTLQDGSVIPTEQAKVGDILRVRPGDRIGLDGTVVSGESQIDTAPITGEPLPVRVTEGSGITSGCVNLSAPLLIRVEKPLAESMVTRILEFVEEAAAGKPKLDRFITRFARIYTPIVVGLSAATAVIPSLITGDWGYWVYTALTFLVMSCPCALVLSVPLAFFSGIGVGSRKGILFNGGSAIEAMAKLKAVVLDKTGTITQGRLSVVGVVGGEEVLTLCASCEQDSSHPIAVSILSAAHGLPLSRPESLEELPGYGIHAKLQGSHILCGNERLMGKYQVELSGYCPEREASVVIVAKDGQYLGHILIGDTLKPGAVEAIAELKAMGLHTAMLTGDREAPAQRVAETVKIGEVHARLLPQDKLTCLRAIRQEHGAVMFVGDGINDAPVLSGADVGAAMGSGADAAVAAADAVFLTNRPDAIPEAIRIARRTQTIAVENVVFALAVKAIVMALGLLGYASMWAAVFADSGVAMLCVLNSVRMLYGKSGRGK